LMLYTTPQETNSTTTQTNINTRQVSDKPLFYEEQWCIALPIICTHLKMTWIILKHVAHVM
jgi:hypothetical protein